MKNLFDLTGKVAIVTGGYGHLGKAMSLALADYGAIVIVGGRSEEKFRNAFGKKENVVFGQLDIQRTESFRALYKNAVESYGRIDIIVNNAFSSAGSSPEQMTDDDWAFTLEGNLGSVHKSIREVLPHMRRNGGGKIINIASMYGMVSPDFEVYNGGDCEKYRNPPHYGASKAAVLQLTKYYAAYLGGDNIQVNAISPGPFPSEAVQQANPEFIRRLSSKNPLGKIGKPDNLAGSLVLLSSSASDFITGHNLVVDGGWTIW